MEKKNITSESTSLWNRFISSYKRLNFNNRLFLCLFIYYRSKEQKQIKQINDNYDYTVPPLTEESDSDLVDSNYIKREELNFDSFDKYYSIWTPIKQIIEQEFSPFPLCHNYNSEDPNIFIEIDIQFIKQIPYQSSSEKFLIFQEPIIFNETLFKNLKPISWGWNQTTYNINSHFQWISSLSELIDRQWDLYRREHTNKLKFNKQYLKFEFKDKNLVKKEIRMKELKNIAKQCVFPPIIIGSIGSVARISHSYVLSINSRWFRSENKGKNQNSSKNARRNRVRNRKEFWYCVMNFVRFAEDRTPSRYCGLSLYRKTFNNLEKDIRKGGIFFHSLVFFIMIFNVKNKSDFHKIEYTRKMFVVFVLYNLEPKHFSRVSEFHTDVKDLIGHELVFKVKDFESSRLRNFFLIPSSQLLSLLFSLRSKYKIPFGNGKYEHLYNHLRKIERAGIPQKYKSEKYFNRKSKFIKDYFILTHNQFRELVKNLFIPTLKYNLETFYYIILQLDCLENFRLEHRDRVLNVRNYSGRNIEKDCRQRIFDGISVLSECIIEIFLLNC